MNRLLSIVLLLGLLAAVVAPLEAFCDGDDCCDPGNSLCFINCPCACSVMVAPSDLVPCQPDNQVVERVVHADLQAACAGYTVLPELPPRFLA